MILEVGDKRREKYLNKDNILYSMRNTGGMAKGIMAGGVTLIGCGVFLLALFAMTGFIEAGIVIGGFFIVLGIPFIPGGIFFHKRKMRNYIGYYQEITGFDADEIMRVEQEIRQPDMVMIGNVPYDNPGSGISEKNPQIACMITKNYFIMPLIAGASYIRRNSDMVLAAYSDEIPGVGGLRHGLVFISNRDDSAYKNSTLTKDACEEIIGTLTQKNPALITCRKFTYADRHYDAQTDGAEIARLWVKQGE